MLKKVDAALNISIDVTCPACGGELETLLDVGLEVTKRTKNEFENIYFNRRIVLSDEDAAAPSAGHDEDDMIPF